MEEPSSWFAKYTEKTPAKEWHFKKRYKSRMKLDCIFHIFIHWDNLNRWIVLKFRNDILTFWHNARYAIGMCPIRNMFCCLWYNLLLWYNLFPWQLIMIISYWYCGIIFCVQYCVTHEECVLSALVQSIPIWQLNVQSKQADYWD